MSDVNTIVAIIIVVIFALIIFIPIALSLYGHTLEKLAKAERKYYVAKFHRNRRRRERTVKREMEKERKRSLIIDGH